MSKNKRVLIGDFETTVFEGQTFTEVWASASVELNTEDVHIFHSIDEQWEYFISLKSDIVVYYHNLKFDGNFWLSYFMLKKKYEQAFTKFNEEGTEGEFVKDRYMTSKTFKYVISDTGQWYTITVKVGRYIIEFRDSLKLLPFSVSAIGKAFKTKHQKLDMEYKGFRYAGCTITEEEKQYIANDVLVVKEAMEQMFEEGHNKLTIGSCCLSEYKANPYGAYDYDELFPDLTKQEINEQDFTYKDADAYIRRSYKGGWCYIVKEKANKIYHNGTTADVNSLYPSMMHSESGNRYPIGLPRFWKGNYIPKEALRDNSYYFVRVRTRFYLKKDYLPFIQIKGSYLYKGTEALETSDVYDKKTGKYYKRYIDTFGVMHEAIPTLTLTMTDFQLLKEHYELVDFEILDGCWFFTEIGIFDNYIDKYKKQKIESKGAKRTEAKLFLNNLYGKMASSTDSSFKVAYLKDDKSIGFYSVPANNKKAGFIAVGSAITSYARNFTIRAAQKNYYGKDKAGFIYADTDSIHCDLSPEEIKGIDVHPSNFCCWKLEASWDIGLFVRQKTYVEHVTHEDLEAIEKPYYNVKCAGMPTRCKDLFLLSMEGTYQTSNRNKLTEEQQEYFDSLPEEAQEFLETKRELTDFTLGLTVPLKLMPKRIQGGVLLIDTTYKMR